MKAKSIKREYIKMLRFDKIKLNNRVSKNIQIAEDLDGIVIEDSVTVGMVNQKLEIRRCNETSSNLRKKMICRQEKSLNKLLH